MKKKSSINCYTINSSSLGINIKPGIKSNAFGLFTKAPTLVIKENPICRYAIEETFKHGDPFLDRRWLVYNDKNDVSFYRFFNSISSEANDFVYILLTYDTILDVSPKLLSNAIFIKENLALIKLNSPSSDIHFTFKDKNFCLTPLELYTY